jgi:hypothetical protein
VDSFLPVSGLDAPLSGCAVKTFPCSNFSPGHLGCNQPLTEVMLIQRTALNAAMGQDSEKGNGVKRQMCGPDLYAGLSVREKKHRNHIFFTLNGTQFNVPQFKVFCHMIFSSSVPKFTVKFPPFNQFLCLMFKSTASQ